MVVAGDQEGLGRREILSGNSISLFHTHMLFNFLKQMPMEMTQLPSI